MKNRTIALLVAGLMIHNGFCSAANSNENKTAEQLRIAVEAALKAKDAKAFLALFNWQGVSSEMKSDMVETYKEEVSKITVVGVKLAPLGDFNTESYDPEEGISYSPNVSVLGLLEIITKENNKTVWSMPYGKLSDSFYISSLVGVKEAKPRAKLKSLSILVQVMGAGLPDSGRFTETYVYVLNGKERTTTRKGVGNFTAGFSGDYVKSCTVQKDSTNRDKHERIQLVISEDSKKVFDSGEIETNEAIVYKKK